MGSSFRRHTKVLERFQVLFLEYLSDSSGLLVVINRTLLSEFSRVIENRSSCSSGSVGKDRGGNVLPAVKVEDVDRDVVMRGGCNIPQIITSQDPLSISLAVCLGPGTKRR